MAHTKYKNRLRGMLPLVLMLLAMGLRVLYVPMHLAHEEHLEVGSHSGEVWQFASHGHDHDHDHDHDDHGDPEDSGHTPHPITDHACDLIVARGMTQRVELQCPQLRLGGLGCLPAHRLLFTQAAEHKLRPPREPNRFAKRQRGPPAAS